MESNTTSPVAPGSEGFVFEIGSLYSYFARVKED